MLVFVINVFDAGIIPAALEPVPSGNADVKTGTSFVVSCI